MCAVGAYSAEVVLVEVDCAPRQLNNINAVCTPLADNARAEGGSANQHRSVL